MLGLTTIKAIKKRDNPLLLVLLHMRLVLVLLAVLLVEV